MIIDRDNLIVMANNNTVVISFSIAILLLLTLLLLVSYNSKCKMENIEKFNNDENNIPDRNYSQGNGSMNTSVAEIANKSANVDNAANGIGSLEPSDPLGNEVYNEVMTGGGNGLNPYENMPESQACFPRDRLTAEDLLPKDAANSKWAQLNPAGAGDIHDQNYLTAGYHIGINTIGQSLRNANLQLRSEPPNPQQAVSPWLISTIEPENRVSQLEIGSAPHY